MTDTAPIPHPDTDPVRIWLTDCHRTLGGMPYGAIAHFERVDLSNRPAGPAMSNHELARHLATNLERLRIILTRVAASNEETLDQLRALRRQVAGLDELADSIARYQAARLDAALDGETWDGTLLDDADLAVADEVGS